MKSSDPMDYLSRIPTHGGRKDQAPAGSRFLSPPSSIWVSIAFAPFPMENRAAWTINPKDGYFILSKRRVELKSALKGNAMFTSH